MIRFFSLGIKLFLGALAAGIILAAYLLYYYSRDLPDYSELANYSPPSATRVYSLDGKLIEEYSKENRIFLPINAMPASLIEAFVASEDKNYYSHPGIDISGIIRAAINNASRIAAGRRLEGASTITQQVVKNFLLSSERSLERKIKEAILSYMISRVLSKEQILELYLNQIYLGRGAYGIAAATKTYFNKSVDELTLAESAMLAGMPKAPSAFNPYTNYDRAVQRRNYVLTRMVEDGYLSSKAADAASKEGIKLAKRKRSNTIKANYYSDEVRSFLIEKFGQEVFYTGGLTVITSLRSDFQLKAEKALVDALRKYDEKQGYRGPIAKIELNNWQEHLNEAATPAGIKECLLAVVLKVKSHSVKIGFKDGSEGTIPRAELEWAKKRSQTPGDILDKGDVVIVKPLKQHYHLTQIPQVNGSMLVMHPRTGEVMAMVGGYDYNLSKFNRATLAKRQPGSLMKPFVYLSALEQNIAPNTIFEDAEIEIYQGPHLPMWKPRNYERNYLGPVTMRRGLEKSRNLVTVRVAQAVGLENVMELMERFDIGDNLKPMFSMALGAFETTMAKITSAYASVVNKGERVTPQFIELVQDRYGKVLYKRDNRICGNCGDLDTLPIITSHKNFKITDAASAYQLVSLMVGSAKNGTSRGTKVLHKNIAGKTGTTNDSRDTWFMGMTPNVVVGTYIGYDTPRSLGSKANGANTALPVFVNFMKSIDKDIPNLEFEKPETIILKEIDPGTGQVVDDKYMGNKITEAFKESDALTGFEPKLLRPDLEMPDVFELIPEVDEEGAGSVEFVDESIY